LIGHLRVANECRVALATLTAASSGPIPKAPGSTYRLLTLESDKCPPIADFCEMAVRLYTPNLNNLGAKSPIVSGLHLKYSRFLETRAGDRARSALRGVGGSTANHDHHIDPILDERSHGPWQGIRSSSASDLWRLRHLQLRPIRL
jgi:hypothetical protein